MKLKLTVLLCVFAVLTACKDDKIVRENDGVNGWVYDVMAQYYLWADFMPDKKGTDMSVKPQRYFGDVLLSKSNTDPLLNDRFSYIQYTGNEQGYTRSGECAGNDAAHDFGFFTMLGNIGGEYYCQVLYVLPGSPADKMNIRRGDCFTSVSGTYISSPSAFSNAMEREQVTIDFFYPEERSVTLNKAGYYDNPIAFDTIYNLSPVTGYFVYNHFTQGQNNRCYDELANLFRSFRDAGVENLVIDLRYNGGGELAAARQLASLMAPRDDLGKVFLYKERNSCYGQPGGYEADTFLSDSRITASNPDVRNVYILTSKATASASELIIHCMRPFFEESGGRFTVVGERTYGKNVGGVTVTNKKYEWEIHPITMRVYDKYKVSGYHTGISPDVGASELYGIMEFNGRQYTPIGSFGDIENENMLRKVMDGIYGVNGWYPPGRGPSVFMDPGPDRTGRTRAVTEVPYSSVTNIPHRGLVEGYYNH